MIRIGITGQAGFVGTHLFNLAQTRPDTFTCIPFEDAFFEDEATLRAFVRQCDAIVHLAAMNRHPDPEVIYQTNLALVDKLIAAMEAEKVTPHVLFSSSTQEERDNLYGASKREGRERLAAWAERTGARFTGCVIPNVFGPYGRPFYNSVVATFCHQLTHGETPTIQVDGRIKLVYVGDLCEEMLTIIQPGESAAERPIPYGKEVSVSELLTRFTTFRDTYYAKGVIPALVDRFDIQLFTTFCGYIDHKTFFPFALKANTDDRGTFVETLRLEGIGGQVSFSTTKPGITRGNHYHTRKIERFAVIKGKAQIQIRRIGTDEVITFELDGSTPAFVDMPVWATHNITNVGDEELYTLFWINEFYNPEDPDTFFEKV
ncbi:MAG: NAD-dependent epimerase/dehydratase family protein [Kiritimatiellae bacterium]|nr:NAD-dependent epimerase/dehydratase family protein [Kiritimatiellia bacterium]